MRLRTIWTVPDMSMVQRLTRSRDRMAFATARRLPSRVRYWAVLLAVGKANATGPYANHSMTTHLEDILKTFDESGS